MTGLTLTLSNQYLHILCYNLCTVMYDVLILTLACGLHVLQSLTGPCSEACKNVCVAQSILDSNSTNISQLNFVVTASGLSMQCQMH